MSSDAVKAARERINQTIWRAVVLAGGPSNVARKFGKTPQSVCHWYNVSGSMPAELILPLCELGGNIITPMQVLESLTEARQ